MKKTTVTTEFQMEYDLVSSPEATRTYILLHGFYENAQIIKEKLTPIIPPKSNILIPNACFPLPKRRKNIGWDLYFSWYFYDEMTQEFYVKYDFPAGVLQKLVCQLGLDKMPITIIGYSQGGYLAPFAAEQLQMCDHVLGLGCSYKFEMLKKSSHFKIDGIHGSIDAKVDPLNAQKCFHKLDEKMKGAFHMLPEVGHELSPLFIDKAASILKHT